MGTTNPKKVNGHGLDPKKRKREKHDDRKAQKKPKQRSAGDPEELGTDQSPDKALVQSFSNGELSEPFLHRDRTPVWKVSNPMGGRMLDIDPVFSSDEKYLILTYNTSIQVYSTSDSLLVRRIPIPINEYTETTDFHGASIVSTLLSKATQNFIWVACSDGRLWKIDWTTGEGTHNPFQVQTRRLIDCAVEHVTIQDSPREILFVLQKEMKARARIVAYDEESLASQSGKSLYTYEDGPQLLRTALNGRLVIGVASQALHLGYLNSERCNIKDLEDLEYRFVSFEVDDIITCLDVRCPTEGRKQKSALNRPVDTAVGFARGKILLFTDILSNFRAKEKSASKKSSRPRKYHWHRRAVHSLKWSQDGNYLISGGSETVLVLWQLDTEKPDFLPHLSASIENVVVSPEGSSYAVHLDDNSTMVLSTSEMTPTAYVSGIQSQAFEEQRAKDALVKRVGQQFDGLTAPLTALRNPADPSQLLLSVGNGQQASSGDGTQSTPLLQVFDLSTFHNITKQAVARTNPTGVNISSQGYPIAEPRLSQLAFSQDAKWLVTIDEWEPPERDLEVIADGTKSASDFRHERLEVYVKFWEVGTNASSLPSLHLSSRIHNSHHSGYPERIYDLAADPTSSRFATVGADGKVRVWTSKVRQNDGLVVTNEDGKALRGWGCSQIVSLGGIHQHQSDLADGIVDVPTSKPQSGALTFSEDGSILFVALGGFSNTVYIIDAQTGVIQNRIHDLFRGDVRAVRSLGPCIITLSEDINVYDIVADELRYGFSLSAISAIALPLTHLAINPASQTFSVAIAIREDGKEKVKRGASSAFAIFSPNEKQPLFENTIPHVITSLLPSSPSSGYLFVDSAAQVWSVSEGPETATVAQPLADINLDKVDGAEENGTALALAEGHEEEAESEDEMEDASHQEDVEMEDPDVHQAVVAVQQLEDIYDAAPAWAMPSAEDLFFQVTALLTK